MDMINEQALRSRYIEKIKYQTPKVETDINEKQFYSILKRFADIVLSVIALVVLSPLLAVVAILIKIEDGGPVIYTRICEGKDGRTYKMYKFRSMQINAENALSILSEDQMTFYRLGGKLSDDPRITKIGKIIRKASIDELPQLFTIIKGDMSLIGPRPVIMREADAYGHQKELLLSRRAGLTGYWQVHGRGDICFLSEEAKLMQLFYVEHFGLKLDLEIFFKTIIKVLKMQGAR